MAVRSIARRDTPEMTLEFAPAPGHGNLGHQNTQANPDKPSKPHRARTNPHVASNKHEQKHREPGRQEHDGNGSQNRVMGTKSPHSQPHSHPANGPEIHAE